MNNSLNAPLNSPLMEAQVPAGMVPGQVFQVQTPAGTVPVQVPAGCGPGSTVRFQVPSQPVAQPAAPEPAQAPQVLQNYAAPPQPPQPPQPLAAGNLMEAQVPAGMQPGQIFQVQTQDGPVPVQVPSGCGPGSTIRFQAPQRPAEPQPQQPTMPPMAFDGVAHVATYRTDPYGNLMNLPVSGLTAAAAEQRRTCVRTGARCASENQIFPENRPVRDKGCIALFALLILCLAFACNSLTPCVNDLIHPGDNFASACQPNPGSASPWDDDEFDKDYGFDHDHDWNNYESDDWMHPSAKRVHRTRTTSSTMLNPVSASGDLIVKVVTRSMFYSLVAAVAFAALFFGLSTCAPTPLVWISLLGLPSVFIAVGFRWVAQNSIRGQAEDNILAFWLIFLGGLWLVLTLTCYRKMVPFTIKVLESMSHIASQKQGLVLVALICPALGIMWYAACTYALVGYNRYVSLSHSHDVDQTLNFVAVLFTFMVFVGTQVFYSMCHTTVAGVFSRWYHGIDGFGAVRSSLKVAMVHSFGSLVFGSMVVAAIRTAEAIARKFRRDARGNPVLFLIACIIEQIIRCLGNYVEFFNEWAYVQCATRGVGFVEAVRITYSMMTCANCQYIITGLLIDRVVTFGSLLSAVVCGYAGFLGGQFDYPPNCEFGDNACMDRMMMDSITAGCTALGALVGLTWAGSILSILSSGTKAVLVNWAENPEPLKRHNPQLHDDFEARIMSSR